MTNYKPVDTTEGKHAPMDMVFWYRDNGFTVAEARNHAVILYCEARSDKKQEFWQQVHNLLIDR